MQINVYDQNGKELKKVTLNPQVFEVFAPEGLIHEALIRQEANARRVTAKAKTRTERRGGGRKPWRQKGTGRARTGSIRSAQWRKGGVIFGPDGLENYSKNMPRKQRIKALLGTLSLKAQEKKVICLDKYSAKDIKTKEFKKTLDALPIDRSVLIVLPKKDTLIQKSASNISNVKVILTPYINIHDLLKFDTLLLFPDTLKRLDNLWGSMFTSNKDDQKKTSAKKAAKPVAKEATTTKKPIVKAEAKEEKAATKAPAKQATTAKKPAAKKAPTKKTTAKKPSAKKTTTTKTKASSAKKPAAKKATTVKKPAAKTTKKSAK